MNRKFIYSVLAAALLISGCSTRGEGVYRPASTYSTKTYSNKAENYSHPTMRPYVIRGIKYYPTVVSIGDNFDGVASWYGPNFHGKLTSNGETYNMWEMTAAHKTLPMNTIVKVTNKRNNRSTIVRVNDRGPFVDNRIIDLSKAAANKLDMIAKGTAPVELEILGFAKKGAKTDTRNAQELQRELKNSPKTIDMDSFALQIASFSKFEGALKTQEEYDKTDGYNTIIKDIETANGRIFKVVLTGFKSEQEIRDYKALGKFQGAFILRED